MAADLAATARLVWDASPGLFSVILFLSLILALVPAATLWVGKLLIDAVALAIRGGFASQQALAAATAEQLSEIPGIGAKTAEKILAAARGEHEAAPAEEPAATQEPS